MFDFSQILDSHLQPGALITIGVIGVGVFVSFFSESGKNVKKTILAFFVLIIAIGLIAQGQDEMQQQKFEARIEALEALVLPEQEP